MKIAACTVVARSTLPYARVLHDSLRRHHPDLPFIALVIDADSDSEPFPIVKLEDLGIPDLRRVRFAYSQQELTYASTPWLVGHLLERGWEGVAFFKQESLVTGDLTPQLSMLERHAILLTPHLIDPLAGDDRVARELNILQSGVYNVGFLGVSAATQGREFVAWWRDRCLRHCVHDVTRGMHFEQRWLDLVPAYFDDYRIIDDPEFNVGHWNLPERTVSAATRFVRFSGFDPDRPDVVTRYTDRPRMTGGLFHEYAAMLKAAGWDEAKQLPYAYDVPYAARKVYRELGDAAARFGDPWTSGTFMPWYERYERRRRGLLARAARLWAETRERDGSGAAIRAVVRAACRRIFNTRDRQSSRRAETSGR